VSSGLSRAAARGTLWLGLVNVLSKGAQVLVLLALGRYLGEAELGTVTIAITLVNVGQTVQTMGVFDMISRTRHDPVAFTRSVASLSVGVGLALAAVLVAAAGPIARLIGAPDAEPLLRVVALSLPFSAYAGVQVAYLHRSLDFRRRLIPDAGSARAGAAVTIVAAAAGAGVWSLIAGVLTTAVLAPVLGLVVGVRIGFGWDHRYVGETLRWSRVTGPGAVIGVLLLQIDYLVVTRALGTAANGIYSFAFRIAFVPYITVAVVIGAVAFPVYARLAERAGDDDLDAAPAVASAFTRFGHVLLASTGGGYLLIGLLADRIVLIDPRWAASAPILRVLCGYGLLLGLVLACHEVTRAIGRPEVYLRAQAVHLVVLTGTAVLLVHPAGAIGVAWAQLIAAAVTLGLLGVVLARAGVLTTAAARGLAGPLPAAAVTVAADLAVRALGLAPPLDSLPGAIGAAALLGVVYAGTLLLLDRSAVADLLSALGRGGPVVEP
jgi:PST family polysaccharide transporter